MLLYSLTLELDTKPLANVILLSAVDLPFTSSCLMPDNGLASLAACLVHDGHRVEVWDPGTVDNATGHVATWQRQRICELLELAHRGQLQSADRMELLLLSRELDSGLATTYQQLEQQLEQQMQRSPVDLLGVKLWFGAGAAAAMTLAARLVARHAGLQVFGGGPAATLAPRRVLSAFPVLRGVGLGDGEETIVGLAKHCDGRRSLRSVPNLVLRDGAGHHAADRSWCELDQLPAPLYDPAVYPAMEGRQKLPVYHLDESRGCPMRCIFCAHRSLGGERLRALSAAQVVERMDHLGRDLGASLFRFSGSLSTGKTYHQVAQRLLQQGRRYRYSGFAHVSSVDPGRQGDRALERMRGSGLVALFLGIESGAPELLSGSLGKKVEVEALRRAVTACLEAGIFTCGSVIFPAPGETARTEEQSFALLAELFSGQPNGAVVIQPAFPSPGSGWWEPLSEHGFEGDPEAVFQALLHRRARLLIPTDVLDPMPYSLDGSPFAALVQRAGALRARLEQQGVQVELMDEMVLTATAVGMLPAAFRDLDRRLFATADSEGLEDLAARLEAADVST